MVSPETLLAWSREPGVLPGVIAGPERGKALSTVTDDALDVLTRDRDQDVRFTAGNERACRSGVLSKAVTSPSQPTLL